MIAMRDNAGEMPKRGTRDDPVPMRLRILRERVFKESIGAFAYRMGFTYNRYLNYEMGYSPLPRDAAIQVVTRIPGLTLDWLFLGERRGLSYDLAVRLGELPS